MRATEFIREGYREVKDKFKTEVGDEGIIDATIEKFKGLVNSNRITDINEKNIDYWGKQGFESFKAYVDNVKVKSGRSIVLQESAEWLIVIPLDKEASCFHGSDTEWCTAKPKQSHFEHYFYKENAILIYCLHKHTGNKWAIALYDDNMELFDKNDNSINRESFVQQTGLDIDVILSATKTQHLPAIGVSKKPYEDQMAIISKLLPTVTVRNSKLEHALYYTKDKFSSATYLRKLIDNSQVLTDIPKVIITQALCSDFNLYPYVGEVPESTTKLMVVSNPQAITVVKNPTSKIKDAFLSHWAVFYRYLNLSEEELRSYFRRYPLVAATYARDTKIRIPEMESLISKDGIALSKYLDVYRMPWKEAESTILKFPQLIVKYVKTNLGGQRWPEAEKVLLSTRNADAAYYLMVYIDATGYDIPGAFDKIKEDPASAAWYGVKYGKRIPSIEDELWQYEPADNPEVADYAIKFGLDEYMEYHREFFERYFKHDIELD